MSDSDDEQEGRDRSSVGLGYPGHQLAKALQRAEETGDPGAERKAQNWRQVIAGMLDGVLHIGSRTPIAGTPAWVTLDVVTGGFATGSMLAGGDLQKHERDIAGRLGIPVGADTRKRLNTYYASEEGLAELNETLVSGRFRIAVPEEGALLVLAWLLRHGDISGARAVFREIFPFFDLLRFFPLPSEKPVSSGDTVFLQDVGATIANLDAKRPNKRIESQAEAIRVWNPFYDRMVTLLLETVDGNLPSVDVDSSGKPVRDARGSYHLQGGRPFTVFPARWRERAGELLAEYEHLTSRYTPSGSRLRRGAPFARVLDIIERSVESPDGISKKDLGYARLALARYLAKRGVPDSETCRRGRAVQEEQCAGPRHHEIARVLAGRLQELPASEGLQDISLGSMPVDAEESRRWGVPEETQIPQSLVRKVGRAQVAPVEDLVEAGYITSADTLAVVLPQKTASVLASQMPDQELCRVYSELYRAFRRRRSLLLLNLESQVKLEELPWVAQLATHASISTTGKYVARDLLTETATLALQHFPQALLPNKLLQEFRSLGRQAELDLPLLDEVAADIFRGRFSAKFAHAAEVAATCLSDSLYQRYYEIDYRKIAHFRSSSEEEKADAFSKLCTDRAESGSGQRWSVAENGKIIEQQQILTSQNLAVLFDALKLRERFDKDLSELPTTCFRWICYRQQLPPRTHHANLIMLKNTAYAWRQMIFFISLLPPNKQETFHTWANDWFRSQRPEFIERFAPAMNGLGAVLSGRDISADGGRRFLGWSTGRHWLSPQFE